jgi:hypothetical protein
MSEARAEVGSFWVVTGAVALVAVGGLLFLRKIDWI